MTNQILLGDCLDILKTLADESCHSCCVDPPYGLGTREPTGDEIISYLQGGDLDHGHDFMGKQWSIPSVSVWREVYRVLKPGGHLLSFGGTRTFDLISVGIRAAGFECRDTVASQFSVQVLQWIQGQGFPKSLSVTKALEKMGLSAEEIAKWEGWGSALKPSWEPVLVFRKPIAEKTVAKQVLKTGTGAINIDACRVKTASADLAEMKGRSGASSENAFPGAGEPGIWEPKVAGRWPANLVLTHSPSCKLKGTKKVPAPVINRFDDGMKPFGEGAGHEYTSQKTGDADGMEEVPVYDCEDGCPVAALDDQAGIRKTSGGPLNRAGIGFQGGSDGNQDYVEPSEGGASRFFTQFETECVEGCPVRALGEQSGECSAAYRSPELAQAKYLEQKPCDGAHNAYGKGLDTKPTGVLYSDAGTAARFFNQFSELPKAPFFYSPKVSKAERDRGLPKGTNKHVSVKPLKLMRHLVKLVTPPGGTVLDPYAGSGTTCVAAIEEGFNYIGIERDPEYHRVAELRCEAAQPKQRDIFEEMEGLE